jgi:DNA invertase Pin-like site-specific DNA recombinase
VAVTKVDRWARSVRDLANSIEELDAAHVRFHAVDQGLSFNRQDPMGKAVAQVVGILAELEANLISARTKEMLEAKGQPGGRPTKACAVCSGEREGGIFAKVSGTKRPVCKECKGLEPARRRELFRENQGEDGDAG